MQTQLFNEFFGVDESSNPLAFVQLHNGPPGDGTSNVAVDDRRMSVVLDPTSGANTGALVWSNSAADTITNFSIWTDPTAGTCLVTAPFGGFVPVDCSVDSSGVASTLAGQLTIDDYVEVLPALGFALPVVLSANTRYYVVASSGSTFSLSLALRGSAGSLGTTPFPFRCQKCTATVVAANATFRIDVGNLTLGFA